MTIRSKQNFYGNYVQLERQGNFKIDFTGLKESYEIKEQPSVVCDGFLFGSRKIYSFGKLSAVGDNKTKIEIKFDKGGDFKGHIYQDDKKLYGLKGSYSNMKLSVQSKKVITLQRWQFRTKNS